MRVTGFGQTFFAAMTLALGILGVVNGDFASVWQEVPKWVPGYSVLAYLCALLSFACGFGLFWPRGTTLAARALFVYLLLWLLLLRVPKLFLAPTAAISWSGCGETAVMVAGGWAIYASLAGDWDKRHLGFAVGQGGLKFARIVFGLACIPCGLAHLAYLKQTADYVPGWLPFHTAWAAATGIAYIVAGLAVLTGMGARLATTLVAAMMGVFTLLIWVPAMLHAPQDHFQWTALVISTTLTAGAAAVADTYHGIPWLALRKSKID
jgi:uncharacterized membrane protein